VTACYLSRRTGRSQNGMGADSWLPRSPAPWPDAGGSAGGADGLGLDPADPVVPRTGARCRVEAPGQPADGHPGLGWPDLVDPAVPPLEGAGAADRGEPVETARARAPGEPADPAAGRPAPRDQPEAAPDDLLPPEADLGGRSSGGAVRVVPPSPSAATRPLADVATPASLRGLGPPSPSAAGGASWRNRDAYASPAPWAVPAASPDATAAAAAPAPAPLAAPAASAAAWPGLRRAHRAAR